MYDGLLLEVVLSDTMSLTFSRKTANMNVKNYRFIITCKVHNWHTYITAKIPSVTSRAVDIITRRPASADSTARRHVLPMGVCPFPFRYQGNWATPASILIPLERQLIALQLCCWQFLWSPYVIGQTIIFSSCSFYLLSFFLSFFFLA